MEKKDDHFFDQGLSNFMHDFASGGAIRHLADLGLTVTEIRERLLFPTPKERVAKIVWEHYLQTGKILLEEPKAGKVVQKVSYVKDYGAYGKVSMRQVTEEVPLPQEEYFPCDYGIRLYQNREKLMEEMGVLSERERQYLLDLPWPLAVVWHVADDRMREIQRKLREIP